MRISIPIALSMAVLVGTGMKAEPRQMVLTDNGVCRTPVIVSENAPQETLRAADFLCTCIEKISGARPQLLSGPDLPPPPSAIWVGIQPRLQSRFPDLNLEFEHPEEILIACDGTNMLIAGRDRMYRDAQTEYGTANSVYTFVQQYLGVRWLWPGPLGEDVIKKATLAFSPFEYRFAPPFLQREIFRREGGDLLDWTRFQRIKLDSFWVSAGHGFGDWWDKYHEEHPEYFALQPDGTRSGYPSPHNAKLCQANPAVWDQWLNNVIDLARRDPTLCTFQASPNDGSNSGICICEKCRAWDHPDGQTWRLSWQGIAQEYVAMTDRYVTFWNRLARKLKRQFPDRTMYVAGMAYGPGKPAPIAATLEDNIVIGYVGHFPLAGNAVREREKAGWREWSDKASRLIFRPNLFYYSGGHHGLPTLVTKNTIEDFRFLAENSGIGITIDGTPRHWATQGPQYYLMAQLAWNPMQDGEALLDDYYKRGFGPAADKVRQYFELMEEAHMGILETPGWRHSMGAIKHPLTECILEQYSSLRLERSANLLDEALAATDKAPEIYRQRVEFVRTGLDFTRLNVDILQQMTMVRDSAGKDSAAVEKAMELCQEREKYFTLYNGQAIAGYLFKTTWIQSRTLEDYLGPPSEKFLKAARLQKVYRWTGRGENNLWSMPANWEVQNDKEWIAATESPGPRDLVYLGNSTRTDEPQRIELGRDITVSRLTIAATGNRSYTITSSSAGTQDYLDADSGMLYRLHLADTIPIEQTVSASQNLVIEVETLLTCDKPATALLSSTNRAHIVIERVLRASDSIALDTREPGSHGLFELKARTVAPRFYVRGGAHLLLNTTGSAIGGTFQGSEGTVLVRRDAQLGSVFQFGGTVHFRIDGAGTNDLSIAVAGISRSGSVYLDSPIDGSTGTLILETGTLDAYAGKINATTFHLAGGTFLDLGGDQQSPARADLSAGIHGPGGLIKSRTTGRDAPAVSIIGDRNTYTGGTFIRKGTLKLAQVTIPADGTIGGSTDVTFEGCLGPGALHIEAGATFDLNGLTQSVSRLSGGGTVLLSGGRLVVAEPTAETFTGSVSGPGTLVSAGLESEL